MITPQEEVESWLSARDYHVAELETDDTGSLQRGGALSLRRAAPGFRVLRFGTGCQLWPLYEVL